jgi:hypothetical protein
MRDGHIIKIKGLLVNLEYDSGLNFDTETGLSSAKKTNGFLIWIEEFDIR